MRIAFYLLAILLFFQPQHAFAADVGCGRDTDLNGVVDQFCPELDKDSDGFSSDGSLGSAGTTIRDCDDQNFMIRPGVPTAIGCPAGQYRTCGGNGVYTGCAALNSFTCHHGSGHTYFVDDAETDCSGVGSISDPEDWRCWLDTNMNGYHAPSPGDCIVFLPGTYSSTWAAGTRQFRLLEHDDVKITALPGSTWWETGIGQGVLIRGAGHFGGVGEVEPIHWVDSDNGVISGFEITTGLFGFSNSGIHIETAKNVEVFNNYVHDIDGEEDNNLSCIKPRAHSDGTMVHHNFVKDCYERLTTTLDPDWNSRNNVGIRTMDSDQVEITHNVVIYTVPAAYGIDFKHGIAAAKGVRVDYNFVIGSGYAGIAIDAIPNSSVRHNFLYNVCSLNTFAPLCAGGVQMTNQGGTVNEFKNIAFEYNTVVNAPAFGALNSSQTGSGGNIYVFRYNVVKDNRPLPYSEDNSTNGFYYVGGYGTDADFADAYARGVSDYNCFYNSTGQPLRFSFFEATSGGWGPAGLTGKAYANFIAWQGIFDRHSAEEDPLFDRYSRATSVNCANKGWLASSNLPPSTPPTPTPTPTLTPTPTPTPPPATPRPTSSVTPRPSPRPSYLPPTPIYTPEPTAIPTAIPSVTPLPGPSHSPSAHPTYVVY